MPESRDLEKLSREWRRKVGRASRTFGLDGTPVTDNSVYLPRVKPKGRGGMKKGQKVARTLVERLRRKGYFD